MRPTLPRPANVRGATLFDLLDKKQIHVSKLHRKIGCAYHKITSLLYSTDNAPDFSGKQISAFVRLGIPLELVCPDLYDALKG